MPMDKGEGPSPDRLRTNRIGKEPAAQIAPKGVPETVRGTPLVSHASSSSLLGGVATGARRWVIHRGSCVDIVAEGSVTKKDKNIFEDVETPMRLNTANGEVTASEKVKVSLKTDTTADALTMKGCPHILSWGKRCAEEGFSFVRNSGKRPVLASPDGQGFELDIESCVPVFHTAEASSSSNDPPVVSGGRPPQSSGGDPCKPMEDDHHHRAGSDPHRAHPAVKAPRLLMER